MQVRVQLELTTKCNSHCAFCPRDTVVESGKRPVEDIAWETLEIVTERLAESPLTFNWLSISGLGEPLMYRPLLRAIKMLHAELPAVPLKMNTNASLLQGRLAEGLIESGLDKLTCSLNVADSLAFVAWKGLSYRKVQDNIIEFLRMKGNKKPDTFVRVNAFDANLPHIKQARQFWQRYLNRNDRFSLGRFSNWAGKVDRHRFVAHDLTATRGVCKFLDTERVVAVDLDGAVFPCCVAVAEDKGSALYLGNLTESPLDTLYNSPRLAKLIERHRQGDYPSPCAQCDSWGEQVENLDAFRSRSMKGTAALKRVIAGILR